jgi:hypothetical protein
VTMPGRRQTRRLARRARRAGLQPVMVVSADGQFLTPTPLIAARVAWRYRSELAPVFAVGVVFGAGWWAHLACPHWWPYLIVATALTAWALVTFGAWLGLARLTAQVYVSVAVFAAGGWDAAAASLGPLTPPLPLVLGASALVLAIPWWADRRRRARARVLRTLAAWPDISREIGLPGSVIQSASVDLWGWRARLRLAHGQTIADVIARIPALESTLGTFRGSVHIYSTAAGRANTCELRVLGTYLHAQSAGWPGPLTEFTTPEGALWLALCSAPAEGANIAELIRLSGLSRSSLYSHLAAHVRAGRAIQVSPGHWRATMAEGER